ncbi:LytR/AlgR family response regulator transcription factor [Ekhidna sp.]|uniref:LytR/AlgR family response regulator transcription factor n=1 Tax=Ekhidna sp. TaxID=2608089 RepID=UPI003BAAA3E2
MNISVALIDDEPFALIRIKKLLQIDDDIQIVGEASGVEDAIKLLKFKKPEIIFMDIKMPDGTGFDILSRLDSSYKPYVIFVTAFDNYALKAFEYNAIDYILKPFENSRFFKVVEKAKEFITLKRSSKITKQISALINQDDKPYQDEKCQIKIVEKGWDIFIDHQDIMLVESNGNYCKLHISNKFYLYKKTMKELESELNSSEFLRIHRSYIVNINLIKEVKYLGKNEYAFELSTGIKITSGRSFSDKIKSCLSLKVGSIS